MLSGSKRACSAATEVPSCLHRPPSKPEVENDVFLLEVSGSPLNHPAVTADPNTGIGAGEVINHLGKETPRAPGQVFFHTSAAHHATFAQIKTIFQSHSPEVHPRSKQTSVFTNRSQNQRPDRTQQKTLLITAAIRAQHQSRAEEALAPCHAVSRWAIRETSGMRQSPCHGSPPAHQQIPLT